MFPALHIAADLKKQAFARLDQGRGGKPKMLQVDANLLIDLCLAFESAAEGDVQNLEYIIKVLSEDKKKLQDVLERISDHVGVDSPVWDMAQDTGVY